MIDPPFNKNRIAILFMIISIYTPVTQFYGYCSRAGMTRKENKIIAVEVPDDDDDN